MSNINVWYVWKFGKTHQTSNTRLKDGQYCGSCPCACKQWLDWHGVTREQRGWCLVWRHEWRGWCRSRISSGDINSRDWNEHKSRARGCAPGWRGWSCGAHFTWQAAGVTLGCAMLTQSATVVHIPCWITPVLRSVRVCHPCTRAYTHPHMLVDVGTKLVAAVTSVAMLQSETTLSLWWTARAFLLQQFAKSRLARTILRVHNWYSTHYTLQQQQH